MAGGSGKASGIQAGATATLFRTSVTDSDPALPFSGGGIENHGDLTLIEFDRQPQHVTLRRRGIE